MSISTGVPNYYQGIPDTFLCYKLVADNGPLIVALEKSAVQFGRGEPPPSTQAEWDAVASAITDEVKAAAIALAEKNDHMRSSDGVSWHHLDLTTELLSREGITLKAAAPRT